MNEAKTYINRLAATMRSAGTNNWSRYDMSDLCECAGMWHEWMNTKSLEEEQALALRAAAKLGVEIRHHISAE